MLASNKHVSHQLGLFEQQMRLLASSDPNRDVCSVAEQEGLQLDDLIYQESKSLAWSGPEPHSLSQFDNPAKHIPLVSFFTGCGGMDLGLETLGFDHKAAFEHNEIFCRTLRKNRPDWKVFGPPFHNGDVSDVEAVSDVLSPLISKPFEGVFVGGPPCQPFSIASNQRFAKSGENFKRVGFEHKKNGSLLFDFVKLILEFRPKAFIVENVPGLRDLDGGHQLKNAIALLTDAGYFVADPMVLNAADHGVPQYRQRLFVVGSRQDRKFLSPSTFSHIGAGSIFSNTDSRLASSNHETRRHKVGSVLRYMKLGYGQRDQLGRVDRLSPVRPSKTVIAGGTNGGGRSHLHPEIPRTLSVRECARLQTFPENYVFIGPNARQFTQVGNAVPPVLAAHVGSQLVKSYF